MLVTLVRRGVVTARIITLTATDLVELTLVSGETIVGTPLHPIWSVEAQDWIELGSMQPGDAVWTEAGPVEVASVSLRSTAETIYNIEVHGHHIYQIGDAGVLVHNAGLAQYSNAPDGTVLRRRAQGADDVTYKSKAEARAEAIRRHNGTQDLFEEIPKYGKNPNLSGPN